MVGEQHVSADPEDLGYDFVADAHTSQAQHVAPATVELLRDRPRRPFFLSVGFFETHRDYFEPTSVRDALYSIPPANLPDSPVTRRDMASFKQSARSLDHGVGAVLSALDEQDLSDETLVILTTDHGLPFPGGKSTLSDRGLGVLLIMRGPGGFHGGRVTDALVSQIDLFPTICALIGTERPEHLQGRSLLPVVRRERREVNDAVFGEITYHAAYDPQRAVRTRRHKYIRRYGDRDLPVLPNIDDSPSKDLLLQYGLAETPRPREELYDLLFDPNEARNLVDSPSHAGVLAELRERLDTWMATTDDPLLDGPVPAPPGAQVNDPDGLSATEAPGHRTSVGRGPLVQRAGELAAGLARERVLDAELVEHADDGAPQVLAPGGVLRAGDRRDQGVEAALLLAVVERGEGLAQLGVVLQPQAGGQALGGEVAGELGQDRERVLALAARGEDAGQRHAGIGARGLERERAAQVVLAAGLDERVGLGRQQGVEEPRHGGRRLRADELGHDRPVAERLDGGDALDPERRGDALVGLGVELGERDLAVALGHGLLEHGRELPARAAPRGPEVDDDRHACASARRRPARTWPRWCRRSRL